MNETLQIVQIGDLIQTKNDKSKQLQSNDYQSNGVLPVVDQGAKPVCGYTNDLSKRYNKGLPVIIFGDHTLHTKFIDFNFAIGADGTQVVVPKNHDCDTKYLYYLISRAANLIGSEGYKRHFKILKEFDIEYIEPLPAQQKIAAILSSVDDVIEKTRAQIDKLKDLKTGMMQELLTKGVGHTEFKDSPVGRIPTSWDVVDLKTVCESKYGIVDGPFGSNLKTEHYRESGIPVFQSGLVTSNQFIKREYVYVDQEKFDEQKRSSAKAGDILMAKIGMRAGACAIIPRNHPEGILAGNSLKMSVDSNKAIAEYILGILHLMQSTGEIRRLLTETAQPAVSITTLKKMKIALPPINEQQVISEMLGSLDTKLLRTKEKLEKQLLLKKALMQDLLTGKVRVKIDQKESAVA